MLRTPSDEALEHLEWPLAYLISYRCYGTWLHGDNRGSVDLQNRTPGQPYVPPDVVRERAEFLRLKHDPVTLSPQQRAVVEDALRQVCSHRGWELHQIAVQTNHLHIVVSAPETPERVMNAFKAWSTRALRASSLIAADAKVWARHGSTRYLWSDDAVADARKYVAEGQSGERFETPEG
ncbi:MAG: transposase [Actinomycetota bacterium]